VESCDNREQDYRKWLQDRIDAETRKLNGLRDKIIDAMRAYCAAFPLDTQEVDVAIAAAGEYREIPDKLQADDLPRFEARFKVLLNENTIREVANFQSQLARERETIKERIALINESLTQIDYNTGRYIVLLDSRLTIGGLSDLTVTAEEFSTLGLPVQRIFVTENDINGLAFPQVEGGMVIFGRGYGFEALAQAAWLRDKEIHYWGDIDSHGFAILSQFRRYFPQTRSLLMDEATLLIHREHWVTESSPSKADLSHLACEESVLYDAQRDNRFGVNVRLKQEYVDFSLLQARLAAIQTK
jgi:hypothetical protein